MKAAGRLLSTADRTSDIDRHGLGGGQCKHRTNGILHSGNAGCTIDEVRTPARFRQVLCYQDAEERRHGVPSGGSDQFGAIEMRPPSKPSFADDKNF